MIYKNYIKRFFDIIFSILIIIILLPVWLVVSIIILLDDFGPIFFIQDRLGMNGTIFKIIKFRTMRVNKNRIETQVFNDNPEVYSFGRFLRRFKIDETPQIINVLKGDMSLIGPRPCLPTLRAKFNENGEKRLKVRPGLTGLAQVNGNIYNSWEKRWEYDAYYVDNLSFLMDLNIFLKTLIVVLFGEKYIIERKRKSETNLN
jgi:lipopolysaccharide/colanic/teichoic acid biosynthesis glycosyltransferase